MARLTGNILLPALRAHFVRPKSLLAILSLRFTSGKKDPTRGPHNVRRPCFGVARWTGFLQAGIGGSKCVLDPFDSFFATIVSIDCEDVEAYYAVCIL
jgi:hypothetical protein